MKRILFVALILATFAIGCGSQDRIASSIYNITDSIDRQASADLELKKTIAFVECIQRGFGMYMNKTSQIIKTDEDMMTFFNSSIKPCKIISDNLFSEFVEIAKSTANKTTKGESKQ